MHGFITLPGATPYAVLFRDLFLFQKPVAVSKSESDTSIVRYVNYEYRHKMFVTSRHQKTSSPVTADQTPGPDIYILKLLYM